MDANPATRPNPETIENQDAPHLSQPEVGMDPRHIDSALPSTPSRVPLHQRDSAPIHSRQPSGLISHRTMPNHCPLRASCPWVQALNQIDLPVRSYAYD